MKNFVLITFFIGVMLIISSFNSMLTGIVQHETWRIITSSISMALTVVMWIIVFAYYKEKRKRTVNAGSGI